MDMNGIGSSYNDLYAAKADQSASKLQNELGTDYSNASDEELMGACQQFEAYFLEQVFKEMLKTVPKSEESSGANASLTDFFQEQMVQNLASQSTEQNSLGLAQSLYEQMKRNYSL